MGESRILLAHVKSYTNLITFPLYVISFRIKERPGSKLTIIRLEMIHQVSSFRGSASTLGFGVYSEGNEIIKATLSSEISIRFLY